MYAGPAGSLWPRRLVHRVGKSKNGVRAFKIQGVWPGQYEVSVQQKSNALCWGLDAHNRPTTEAEYRTQQVCCGALCCARLRVATSVPACSNVLCFGVLLPTDHRG